MKIMKHHLNERGSILQLVLIIFVVLVLNLNLVLFSVIDNSRSFERIVAINQSRLVELSIIRYYKETILNDILFSDEIIINDYTVNYTVDDMGSYYYIFTTVEHGNQDYSFALEINIDTLLISKFDYR